MANYVEHQTRLHSFIAQAHEYPADRFSGRGIVICAGGVRYFTNAYVCVRILRMQGCTLPIQFWHLGPDEIDDEMRALVAPLGVECIDAHGVRKEYPARILNGWELKPYAMIHSPFEEVICLDADNVALIDPEALFETDEYKRTGAIFWPDFNRLQPTREIWEIMGIPYRDEPEFESGQVVVDKRRCWKALQVTMHLNEWSDFYYGYIHGDKETFHMAWRKIEQDYSMPERGIDAIPATMCQHDFQGNRIFQHRNMRKWQLNGHNEPVPGFLIEDKCLEFLADLRAIWSKANRAEDTPAFKNLANKFIEQRNYQYIRVGFDFRPIEFRANGVLLAGAGAIETGWGITGTVDAPKIAIFDGNSTLCELSVSGGNMLIGKWLKHEKMQVVCIPITNSQSAQGNKWTAQNGEDVWLNDNISLPVSGVFVEVGAATGVRHSNTYWLEERGWTGLLVEADERNLDAISKSRRAPVVHCAATDFDGDVRFVQHADVTLSGIARPEEDGVVVTVPARQMDGILQERGITHVDVMSIDTEGTECDVLKGLGQVRPTILIVEYLTAGADENNLPQVQAVLDKMGYVVLRVTESNVIARYDAAIVSQL